MSDREAGFVAAGAWCLPVAGEPARFFYLPLRAACRRRADGAPEAGLIEAGDRSFLQIATEWDLPAAWLEALRATLAARAGIGDARLVQLTPMPVNVEAVRLIAGDGGREAGTIATARASGIAPQAAMFHVELTGADRARAAAAFAGRRGFLIVRYEATAHLPDGALPVDAMTDVGDWFGDGAAQGEFTTSMFEE